MRDVNESVGAFVRSMALSGVDEVNPETGVTTKRRYRPEEISNAAEEYRQTLIDLWGLSRGQRTAGTPSAGAAPAGRNAPAILNDLSPYGAEGPASPMEWSSSSGRRFRF